jgi:hypothetical protein
MRVSKLVDIEDRFTRGFLAGLAAGMAMNIFSFISMALGWVKIAFLDWAGVLIFGKLPAGVLENAVSLGGQLFFAAMSGVLFAYLLPVLTSRNYFLKGLIFGLLIWLLSYTASILFRVPFLTRFDPGTVTSNITGALIYGLVLGFVLKWLEERAKTS